MLGFLFGGDIKNKEQSLIDDLLLEDLCNKSRVACEEINLTIYSKVDDNVEGVPKLKYGFKIENENGELIFDKIIINKCDEFIFSEISKPRRQVNLNLVVALGEYAVSLYKELNNRHLRMNKKFDLDIDNRDFQIRNTLKGDNHCSKANVCFKADDLEKAMCRNALIINHSNDFDICNQILSKIIQTNLDNKFLLTVDIKDKLYCNGDINYTELTTGVFDDICKLSKEKQGDMIVVINDTLEVFGKDLSNDISLHKLLKVSGMKYATPIICIINNPNLIAKKENAFRTIKANTHPKLTLEIKD